MHRSSSSTNSKNVCSCGKFFGIYSEATSCESKKNRIELKGLPYSGNQPSLTEKFDTVYGIAEQSEHTSNKMIAE